MVLRNDTIASAEKELMALHEREEKLRELLEVARREHNEAVADRHRVVDADEAGLASVNTRIAALRRKFDELVDALAVANMQREAAEQHCEQLVQVGGTAFDIDERIDAIQDALTSFRSASQDLADKLTGSVRVSACLTSSVFKTADVLDYEVYGVIGALKTAKAEILSVTGRAREVNREPRSVAGGYV